MAAIPPRVEVVGVDVSRRSIEAINADTRPCRNESRRDDFRQQGQIRATAEGHTRT